MSLESATITRFAQAPRTPWRNRSGTTRELLVEPSADPAEPFNWRISVADVTHDGPFSTFDGVDRVLMLCQGAGLVVVVNGCAEVLRRFDTVTFPGEAHVTARLVQGPTIDLNIMTTRATTGAGVRVQSLDGRSDIRCDQNDTIVLVLLEGSLALHSDNADPPETLKPFDAVRLDGTATTTLIGQGRFARIDLRSRI